jgi:signal recognition particle receptor subunit beta
VALINHRTHEIHFKIVYYGPGLCGKTTNLRSLHDKLPPERRGKMISIATDHERTLFFDFLPIDLGQVNGFLTRFHLYTVPGQVYYKLSRRAVLQGVDGLVFVADSHPSREAANRESLADLQEHLRTLGITGPALARIPWVFQWNKRDLPVTLPVERLHSALNPNGWPEYEAVASTGAGVSETLRAACKAVLARLSTGASPAGTSPSAPAPVATPAPPAAATLPPPAIARPGAALGSVPPPSAVTTPSAPARPTPRPYLARPITPRPTVLPPRPAGPPAARVIHPRPSTPPPVPASAPSAPATPPRKDPGTSA